LRDRENCKEGPGYTRVSYYQAGRVFVHVRFSYYRKRVLLREYYTPIIGHWTTGLLHSSAACVVFEVEQPRKVDSYNFAFLGSE
jgi:hypothetical protein